MPFFYLCSMGKRRMFQQEYFRIDFESADQYLIIIEIEDEVPLGTFIVKLPRFYPQFPITPYLVN